MINHYAFQWLDLGIREAIMRTWNVGRGQGDSHRIAAFLDSAKSVNDLLDKLGGDELLALRIICQIGNMAPKEILLAEIAAHIGDERCKRALAALGMRALAFDNPGAKTAGLPDVIASALLPYLPELPTELRTPASASAPPPRADVRLLVPLLLGWVKNRRPRLTQSGDLFKKDTEEALATFAPVPASRIERLLAQITRVGHACDDGHSRLALSDRTMENYLGQSEYDQLRFALEKETSSKPGQAALDVLVGAGGKAVARSSLERAARLAEIGRGSHYYAHSLSGTGIATEAANAVDKLLSHPAILRETVGEHEWVALPVPTCAQPRTIYVQPNFDILVPPETSPKVALELASIAEIKKVDVMATLSLTQVSLRAAAEMGWKADRILALLGSASGVDVPPTVERLVRDYVKPRPQVRMARGLVVVIDDAEAATLFETSAETKSFAAERLASGVYLVDRYQEDSLRRVLNRAKFRVSMLGDTEPNSHEPDESRARGLLAGPPVLASTASAILCERIKEGMSHESRSALQLAPFPVEFTQPREEPLPRAISLDELEDAVDREEANQLLSAARLTFTDPRSILRALERAVERGESLIIEVSEQGQRQRTWIEADSLGFRGPERILRAFDLVRDEDRVYPMANLTGVSFIAGDDPAPPPNSWISAVMPDRSAPKVGRNQPCPCGSGRKYKRCCIDVELTN